MLSYDCCEVEIGSIGSALGSITGVVFEGLICLAAISAFIFAVAP
jgi:hypothetical protein